MSKDRNECEVTEIERMAYEMERLFIEAERKQTIPKKHPSIVKAEALYNVGYRKQEWISVDERLPEVGTRVVGYDYESNVRCYFITENRWWIDDGWNTAKGWGITHWMPLPKAPKMKGGAE